MKEVQQRFTRAQWKTFAILQGFIRHRDLLRSPAGTKFEEANARLIPLPMEGVAVFAATYWEGGMALGEHVCKLFREVLDDYGVSILGEDQYPPSGDDGIEWTRVMVIDSEGKTRAGCDIDLDFLVAEYNNRAKPLKRYGRSSSDPTAYKVEEECTVEFEEWFEDLCSQEPTLISLEDYRSNENDEDDCDGDDEEEGVEE